MGYDIPKQCPNVWEMLKELDQHQLYQFYIYLSAYTHSNFEAASLYKKHLGDAKELGEFITERDWFVPFNVAWKSFYQAAEVFLRQIEADISRFERRTNPQLFEDMLAKL